jgi:hypothetical protein
MIISLGFHRHIIENVFWPFWGFTHYVCFLDMECIIFYLVFRAAACTWAFFFTFVFLDVAGIFPVDAVRARLRHRKPAGAESSCLRTPLDGLGNSAS